jgi:hypothetical protein
MSPWVPLIVSSSIALLTFWLMFAKETYFRVTTVDETKEHLRKLRSWVPALWRAAAIAVQAFVLFQVVISKEPLTRFVVLSIAISVGSLYFLLSSFFDLLTLRLIGRVIDVQRRVINVQDRQVDLQGRQIEVQGRLISLAEDEAAEE